MGGRRLIPNPYRGERWVELSPRDRYIARPTFGAIAAIEAEHGPLLDVAELLGDPSRVTLRLLAECLMAWICAGSAPSGLTLTEVEQCAVGRMGRLLEDAQRLVFSYFETGRSRDDQSAEPSRSREDRSFPWRDLVGVSIGVWGMSADEAWGLTTPEWWAACDAYAAAHGGKVHDGPTPHLSREKALEMAEELRSENRAEQQAAWIRERKEDDGSDGTGTE